MTAGADVARAWARWDAEPSNRARVVVLNRAVAEFAVQVGRSAVEVDRQIQDGRRDGLSIGAAIERIQAP